MHNLASRHPYHISIRSYEQLLALKDFAQSPKFKASLECIQRIYVYADLVLGNEKLVQLCKELDEAFPNSKWILLLPEVIRAKDIPYLKEITNFLSEKNCLFNGICSGSLEAIGYFVGHSNIEIYGDHNLYLWNSAALSFWAKKLSGGCLPLELHGSELAKLATLPFAWEKIVYGRIPMMLSANCVAKTNHACKKETGKDESVSLIDRMNKKLPVLTNCQHCFNVIYNSVPLSLHGELSKYPENLPYRLQFTTENQAESKEVLGFFLSHEVPQGKPPYGEYTTGREKAGVQ
ncbi:MAG: hypothetical protein II477_04100 [Lachnospiraceae bacterium]|nr:hypothetical protein [Lachnospiraceae bacterium]